MNLLATYKESELAVELHARQRATSPLKDFNSGEIESELRRRADLSAYSVSQLVSELMVRSQGSIPQLRIENHLEKSQLIITFAY